MPVTEEEKGFLDWAFAQGDPNKIKWDLVSKDFPELKLDPLKQDLGISTAKPKVFFPKSVPPLSVLLAEKLATEDVSYREDPATEQAKKSSSNLSKGLAQFATFPAQVIDQFMHPGMRPPKEEVPGFLRGTEEQEATLERPSVLVKGLFQFGGEVLRSIRDLLLLSSPTVGIVSDDERIAAYERLAKDPAIALIGPVAIRGLMKSAGKISAKYATWKEAIPEKIIKEAQKEFVAPKEELFKKAPEAERLPYAEAIKTAERPEMTDIETYYKSITAPPRPEHPMGLGGAVIYPQKLGIPEAQARGIALRKGKGGKRVPAVREAGTFVPEDFATYPNFKDAKQGIGGGTKDPIRFIQEIDGALPVQRKVQIPSRTLGKPDKILIAEQYRLRAAGQEGPAERYILRRTEDMIKLKIKWSGEQMIRGKKIVEGLSRKQEELVTQVLEETSRPGAFVETADFAKNPRVKAITADIKIVRAAQESRKVLEHWIAEQNKMRRLRNQEEIRYRQYYAPHKIREATLWSRRFGLKEEPITFIERPQLPDYIKPDKPFNPRELAREAEMPHYLREMRISKLLEDYANTAARDIFHTSIIQNGKAFVQQLESMGYKNAARGVGNWMAEGFGGIKGAGDRFLDAPRLVRKGMRVWRTGLIRSVFPLNWMWNTVVQTSSGVLTVARAGSANAVRGAVDWFGSKKLRGQIVDNAYSAMIKAQKAGKITEQDINIGMTKAVKLRKTKFETAVDAANYLTEFIERHLTGWSIASGLRQGAQRGMRGKALWDYASDMGAKTQSMYNLENLPGILRSEVVKTAAPFQTFSFELFNSMREFLGKTGTPPGTASQRIGWALRFMGGVVAVQQIGRATTGRKPYDVYSFFPFADTWLKPIVNALMGKEYETAAGRGLPSPVSSGTECGRALRTVLKTGDTRRIRNWSIKYLPGLLGIPAGTQVSRMVDGIIAVADGGLEDSSDRMLFPITETKEQIRAITMGPWRTEAGKEYWEEREVPFTELFKRKEKKEVFPRLRGTP